jgi:hypothetical protein
MPDDRVHAEYAHVERAPFMQAPDAATSSRTIAASVMPAPPPPYCCGMAMPIQPAFAIFS